MTPERLDQIRLLDENDSSIDLISAVGELLDDRSDTLVSLLDAFKRVGVQLLSDERRRLELLEQVERELRVKLGEACQIAWRRARNEFPPDDSNRLVELYSAVRGPVFSTTTRELTLDKIEDSIGLTLKSVQGSGILARVVGPLNENGLAMVQLPPNCSMNGDLGQMLADIHALVAMACAVDDEIDSAALAVIMERYGMPVTGAPDAG